MGPVSGSECVKPAQTARTDDPASNLHSAVFQQLNPIRRILKDCGTARQDRACKDKRRRTDVSFSESNASYQKISFIPSWMLRGSRAELITPNVPLLLRPFVPGTKAVAVVLRIQDSRDCHVEGLGVGTADVAFSQREKFLITDRSTLMTPGFLTSGRTRPTLP